jgi:hypothetical protein
MDALQMLYPGTSHQVREELEDLVRRDLLGPWGGETEVFAPRAKGPLERYLVGRLGPKPDVASPGAGTDDALDSELPAGGGGDTELADRLTPANTGRLWASTMGMSFAVAADTDAVQVTVSWGRYHKAESLDDDGAARRVWAREPVRRPAELRLDGETTRRIPLTVDSAEEPGVHLRAEIRPSGRGTEPGARVVELALVNTQPEPHGDARDTAWLFQAELDVTALDGARAVFPPIDDPLAEGDRPDDSEERHLRLLYREELRYAAGRNVAVHAEVRDGERRAHRLRTTWLPTYEVPATVTPTGEGAPG